jgi:hypothetical protein
MVMMQCINRANFCGYGSMLAVSGYTRQGGQVLIEHKREGRSYDRKEDVRILAYVSLLGGAG